MTTTVTTAIEQQSFNPYYFANIFIDSSLEVLDDTEIELESIMLKEFPQGLPSDIDSADF
jgi:hypothetical protein